MILLIVAVLQLDSSSPTVKFTLRVGFFCAHALNLLCVGIIVSRIQSRKSSAPVSCREEDLHLGAVGNLIKKLFPLKSSFALLGSTRFISGDMRVTETGFDIAAWYSLCGAACTALTFGTVMHFGLGLLPPLCVSPGDFLKNIICFD